MKTSSNRVPQNNLYIQSFSGRAARVRRERHNRLTPLNMFIALMVTFVAVAAMQAFQLNDLLSDAKDVGRDLAVLSAEQEVILNSYISQTNHLSGNVLN